MAHKVTKDKLILVLAFLLIPFFKPIGPTVYVLFNRLFQVWKLFSVGAIMIIMAVTLFRKQAKFCPYKELLGLFLFWAIYVINGMVNGTSFIDVANNGLTSLVLLSFILFLCSNGYAQRLLQVLAWIFGVYLVLHLISVVLPFVGIELFKEPGIEEYTFFLGRDNFAAFAVYPMLGVLLFYLKLKKQNLYAKLLYWGMIVAVFFCFLSTWSVTAMLAGVVFLVFLLAEPYWNKVCRLLDIRWIIGIIVIAMLLISSTNIFNPVIDLVEDILNKNTVSEARLIIWSGAAALIAEKPLFGHGVLSHEQVQSFVMYGAEHAHNIVMEILLRTGIVGGAGYLWFLTGASIKQIGQKGANSSVTVLHLMLVTLIILFMLDFYPLNQYFYCFMGVYYCADRFASKKEENCQ